MDIAARLAALQAELERLDADFLARRAPVEEEMRKLIELFKQELAHLHKGLGLDAVGSREALRAVDEALRIIEQQSTLSTNTMQAPTAPVLTKSAKTSAAMTRSKAPFSLALMLAHLSMPEWVDEENKRARRLKTETLSVEVARSWVKPKKNGGRSIRPYWAKRVEATLGVAAVPENWPNGIRE